MAEVWRVLRHGGCYAFTDWCVPDKTKLFGLAHRALENHADMDVSLPPALPMIAFSDPEVGRPALQQRGFRDVVVEAVPIRYRAGTADEVFDFFEQSTLRLAALLSLQTSEAHRRIRTAILDGARAYCVVCAGVDIPCPALLYVASRP